MKNIICKNCCCEIELTETVVASKMCPICNANLDDEIIGITENTQTSVELLCVECMERNKIVYKSDRKLHIFDSHLSMIKNNGEICFDESYDNIVQLKPGSYFIPDRLTLELKNGDTRKITLSALNGGDPVQLGGILANRVNQIIKKYKEKLVK